MVNIFLTNVTLGAAITPDVKEKCLRKKRGQPWGPMGPMGPMGPSDSDICG